ncbi:uncharacterized protein IL334_003744 [Kwoniella shivajii]|uniref:Rrn9 domain-containing protein n=1 Tax=Kwoniella shivajii TaxID=564305 RepID=A0ABZ1CYR6_9TREE|nr:hypothetical protein IL334_003744 [Kwoniella shivajii]
MEQVDLVRALESIDNDSHILAHHVAEQDQEQGIDQASEREHIHIAQQTLNDLQPNGKGSEADGEGEADNSHDGRELNEWTREQLQAEIVKLRRLAQLKPCGPQEDKYEQVQAALTAVSAAIVSTPIPTVDPSLQSPSADEQHAQSGVTNSPAGELSKKRVKRKGSEAGPSKDKKIARRDEETGKRLEKDRKTELAKSIRIKMRSTIGVGLDDPLPPPSKMSDPPSHNIALDSGNNPFVPDWNCQLNDEINRNWVAKISHQILEEALVGLHPRIPTTDMNFEIIDIAAKTAFVNMCKRYTQENDPKGVERRDRYTKKRRRWARKDLKQKRRKRSAVDPSFQDVHIPPSALHLDYMSSEYSSAGEETDPDTEVASTLRKEKWEAMLKKQAEDDHHVPNGKGGWAVGISEKVLEVRTPRWRSEELNDIYRRLDAHANQFSDTRASGSMAKSKSISILGESSSGQITVRPGHVAPSHRRFTMSPGFMRKGGLPRDLGEGWMWASGVGGIWAEDAAHWIGAASAEQEGDRDDPVQGDLLIADSGEDIVGLGDEIEGENEMEEARLGLVSALEGL